MMDHNLKPWLLEVNTNPSLTCSSPLDRMLKTSLVCDMYNIIGFKVKTISKISKISDTKVRNTKKKTIVEHRNSQNDKNKKLMK